ncbi:hypothetical protein ACJJTC_006916 [Scirpophaga incertulas]
MLPPIGILAKNFGGKPIFMISLVSNTILCALVPTLAAWGDWVLVCACRVIMGMTQACFFSGTHTLIGQWLPESERTSYSGIIYGGVQIGIIIAMPLSGILAESAMGWKLIFYTISGILLGNSLIWYSFAASSPREHRMISKKEKAFIEAGLNVLKGKPPPAPWKQILKSKATWALLAPQMGFTVCFVLFFVETPTYLEKGLHISLKNSALLSALPFVGKWCGSTAANILCQWISNKGLLSLTACRKVFQSVSLFGGAIGLVILSLLGPENKILAVITLISSLTLAGFSSAGFLVNHLDLSPNFGGIIFALLDFITNFVVMWMPIATGYILQNDSSNISRWKLIFILIAAFCVATNIIYLLFGTSERQVWDDPNYLKKREIGDPEELELTLKENEEKHRQQN